MNRLYFDVAHLLAGGLVLTSFVLLYQDRLSGLRLRVSALPAPLQQNGSLCVAGF